MERAEKEDIIKIKCDRAGCSDEARKRHFQAYVFERWDVHPNPDFWAWVIKKHEDRETAEIQKALDEGRLPRPRTKHPNPITAWNSDPERVEWENYKDGT